MPILKLKYHFTGNYLIELENLTFDTREIDFREDEMDDDRFSYKNKESVTVYPRGEYLLVTVRARANAVNATWTMDIWVDDKKITDTPITASGKRGRADYRKQIKWKV